MLFNLYFISLLCRILFYLCFHIGNIYMIFKQKNMCVYDHMSKKSRVGRSALIFYFIFLLLAKPEIVVPESPKAKQKKYVCLQSPDRHYFSAADPNLF
jgi:hypothetical protein